MATLLELKAMLDAATGPSHALNADINRVLGAHIDTAGTHSTDAALALVERLLPNNKHGVQIHIYNKFGEAACKIGDCFNATFEAPTAPLAILKAIVAALIAQEQQT